MGTQAGFLSSGRAKLCLTLLVLGGVLVGKEFLEIDSSNGSSGAAAPLNALDDTAPATSYTKAARRSQAEPSLAATASPVALRDARQMIRSPGSTAESFSAPEDSSGLPAADSPAVPVAVANDVTTQTTTLRPDPYCKLPPMAPIHKIQITKDSKCVWTWIGTRGACVYKLVGDCQKYHHKATNCTFYGHSRNEQRGIVGYYLPEAKGEIPLSKRGKTALKMPFSPCHSRPQFWMITTPPLATPEKPLPILAGGAPTLAQHIYYVEGEVAGSDVYSMHKQKPEDMKIIVDLGGNIGLFAISACKRFPKARILAFEPHPGNYRFLVYNLAAAGCSDIVETYNKGLSMDGRRMRLFWHDSIGTSAYRGPTAWNPKPPTIDMETITPDGLWDIVGRDKTISLMKVDCEGCEYEIVPMLPRWRVERMFCEVHDTTVNVLVGHTAVNGMTEKLMKQVKTACGRGQPYNTSTVGRPASLAPSE